MHNETNNFIKTTVFNTNKYFFKFNIMILEDWLKTSLQFPATPTKSSIKYLKKKGINITF